ncbi:MAG: hypothetical protein AMXMBFR34_42790 [Myxococcaceae bacterium]
MRTTIRLDSALMREAKKLAAARGTTFTAIVESALRDTLRQAHEAKAPRRIRLPTSRGRFRDNVNLDRTSELLDLMDGLDAPQ